MCVVCVCVCVCVCIVFDGFDFGELDGIFGLRFGLINER